MFGLGTPVLLLVGLGGLLALFGVGTLLFQAGCALADVPERGYFRALPIYALALVLCLPAAAALVWYAGRYESDPNESFGAFRLGATVLSLLFSWFLSAGVYALLLAASLRKGLLIAGIELVLMALLAALVSAVVLVVLSLVQITTRPPPARTGQTPPSSVRAMTMTVPP
jgi:hypothetical protein